MLLRKRQQGQSTVEYIVLVTGVLVIMIAFLVSPTSPFAKRMNSSLDAVTIQVNKTAQNLVSAQQSLNVVAVNTDIIGNKASAGLCPAGKFFNPADNTCS